MHSELERIAFGKVLPLFENSPKDPMLYSVLEGVQPGRIFVDHAENPKMALVWGGMEYAYLGGEVGSADARQAVFQIVEEVILPAVNQGEYGFVSIFPEGEDQRKMLLDLFEDRQPVSFGVNIYTFDAAVFKRLAADMALLPEGYTLVRLDRDVLGRDDFQYLNEDISFCWESVDRFFEVGLGFSILYEEKSVSSCYAIGYGAGGYHITICTYEAHRRKGLAKHVAAAFLSASLEDGKAVYWLNDAPNTASRKLAESLGFRYLKDLYPVDIPAEPYGFHLGLAAHFYHYLKMYEEAGELYERAFKVQAGDGQAYFQAAKAWARAGMPEKAFEYLEKGAFDRDILLGEEAFETLHALPQWGAITG